MVSLILLCVELMLDLLGLVAGIIILKRSSDNGLQRAWGVLASFLSFLLLYDNSEWFYIASQNLNRFSFYIELPIDHLSLWHIVRVIVFFQFFSLFPIASLKPGWLTASRIISLSIPAVLISCIAICYAMYNGHYTPLRSFSDIYDNWGNRDVRMRMTLFILSVITPSCNFLFPYLRKWIPFRRRQSRAMCIYMICFVVIMSGYIWLMLGTSALCFHLFGYIVIIPALCLNILYLRNENPLSLPPSPVEKLKSEEIEAIKEIEISPAILELATELKDFIQVKTPFTNPAYTLQQLQRDLGTNEHRLAKVLRYEGFSGFRDYINFNRLQYFKKQTIQNKDLTIKELMYKSGFASRSSFYRYFSSIEKISPSEYMDMIHK